MAYNDIKIKDFALQNFELQLFSKICGLYSLGKFSKFIPTFLN